MSHPTDLATFSVPRKAPLSPRFASRAHVKDEEDYEEHEEIEEEWGDTVVEKNAEKAEPEPVTPERTEEEFEETEPKFAASFMPYFRKNKPDQFKESEELATDDLNRQAQTKYIKAVEGKDTPKNETIRYRLEVARSRVNEEEDEIAPYNVADVYREQYIKRERTFFAHLQPSNQRPFGSNDSLFFPLRSTKVEYPVFRKFAESPEGAEDAPASKTRSGSAQHREYSTVSSKKKYQPRKDETSEPKKKVNPTQARDYSSALAKARNESAKMKRKELTRVPSSSKEERLHDRKLSAFTSSAKPESFKEHQREKQKHPDKDIRFKAASSSEQPTKTTFKTLQTRKQSSQLQTAENTSIKKPTNLMSDFKQKNVEAKPQKKDLTPGSLEEKQVIDRALDFAQKYRDIYLSKEEQNNELKVAQTGFKEDPTVELLLAPKPKPSMSLRTTSRLSVPQSSAPPEEVARLEVKAGKNERLIAPWPAYSETVRKPVSPVTYIKFPNEVLPRQGLQRTATATMVEAAHAREYSTRLARSAKKVKR